MKRILALLAALCCLASTYVPAENENLIYNGAFDMEEGGRYPEGWYTSGWNSANSFYEVTEEDGWRCLYIDSYENNDARWVQQERGQLDYDAKNMMHLTRLLFSGENIVTNGCPIVRFEGEKLETLLSIRRGEWAFDKIIAHAEAMQARIVEGKERLPPDCDKEKVGDLIAAVMRKAGVA